MIRLKQNNYAVVGLPWQHGIGKDVKDCHSSAEVMEKSKLDFSVAKCELYARMPVMFDRANDLKKGDFVADNGVFSPCPNAYSTYRTDKNIPLGVVKEQYTVIQNSDAFKFFDDAIGENKAQWQYAGYYGYGHKIFVTAKLPIDTDVNGDKIDNYLVFSNNHDGNGAVSILFTPVRVFCLNCLQNATKKAASFIKIRHTQSAKEKLELGAQVLRIACENAVSAQELYNSLYKIKMSDDEVLKYLSSVVLSDAEQEAIKAYNPTAGLEKLITRDFRTMEVCNISTRKVNILNTMYDYYCYGIGQQDIKGNAWGAYNAVTGFYSNCGNYEGIKRFDSILYGTADSNMRKALDLALSTTLKVAV